jgi:glutaconate CoA-transferase subunit A
MGVQREAAFASDKVIIVAEEFVDKSITRSDPNRTIIPGMKVDAVVIEPFGAHPSYAQGYYDRDNQFYVDWSKISKNQTGMENYISEWIFGVSGRQDYISKMGKNIVERLKADKRMAAPINYGY